MADDEMEIWLRCDRTVLTAEALHHYRLSWHDTITAEVQAVAQCMGALMKITFLHHSVDRVGGITKATLTNARALIDRGHDVGIAAVFRERDTPRFDVDPRIRIDYLIDITAAGRKRYTVAERRLAAVPSRFYPESDAFYAPTYSCLADECVRDYLRRSDANIIVATTPGLNVYLSTFCPSSAVAICQEHLGFANHRPGLRDELARVLPRVDSLVTVSGADAADYRKAFPRYAEKVEFIPNPVPVPTVRPTKVDDNTIIAAGRLDASKNFGMLVTAFRLLVNKHPSWRLRIYGEGEEKRNLEESVKLHNLEDSVVLMGECDRMETVWSTGSIAAVTSIHESFGLTIVEAMSYGLPVVSTRCPHGPPEIIHHDVDGILTPVGDPDAFAVALSRLIEEPHRRHLMSQAAATTASTYAPDRIAVQYEQMMYRLTG